MPQLTPQESFRLGFLLRCAEEGCTAEEIQERVKFAAAPALGALTALWSGLKGAVNPTWNAVKTMGTFPLHATALGVAGAAGVGAAGGYGLAKMQNSDVDPEEAKRQELMAAYQLQAELARRRASQRSYRRDAPAMPSFL